MHYKDATHPSGVLCHNPRARGPATWKLSDVTCRTCLRLYMIFYKPQ